MNVKQKYIMLALTIFVTACSSKSSTSVAKVDVEKKECNRPMIFRTLDVSVKGNSEIQSLNSDCSGYVSFPSSLSSSRTLKAEQRQRKNIELSKQRQGN